MGSDELELLNVKQVAELLQVTVSFIYDQVEQHEMPYIRLGRLLRFRREDLVAWLDTQSGGSVEAKSSRRWHE